MIYIIPLQILSIQEDGFHLAFEAKLGEHSIRMLLDTGASRTVFDKDRISELLGLKEEDMQENPGTSGGIGTAELQSNIASIPEFRIGDYTLHSYQAAFIDLQQVNYLFSEIGLPPVQGILGGDILKDTNAVIDYGKKLLKLRDRRRKTKNL